MNFVVIGGGSIGKRHIRNLLALGHTGIFCLRRDLDPSFEENEKVKVITSVTELKVPIAAVFVCTPTSLHVEGLKIASQLNCALFMEKPLIHSKRGLAECIELLDRFSHPFFIGFMLRYHPLVKKMKAIMESGTLGKVYSARFEFGSYLPYWHPWEDHKISYASRRDLGGGVINTITHELDLIQYFFGSPNAVTCVARNFGKLGIEVEEIADAIFNYDDKAITLHLDYLQKDYNRSVKILCDNGAISWNWHDQKIVIVKHGEGVIEEKLAGDFDVNQLYMDELKDFINSISTKSMTHPLNAQHAIVNTQVMLAMHESAACEQRVNINLHHLKKVI